MAGTSKEAGVPQCIGLWAEPKAQGLYIYFMDFKNWAHEFEKGSMIEKARRKVASRTGGFVCFVRIRKWRLQVKLKTGRRKGATRK